MAKGPQPPDDLAVDLSWPHSVEPPAAENGRHRAPDPSVTRSEDLEAIMRRLDTLTDQVQALTDLIQTLATRRAPARRRSAD